VLRNHQQEGINSFESSVNIFQITRRNIPEDSHHLTQLAQDMGQWWPIAKTVINRNVQQNTESF
jgi:hypothetical protein